MFVLNGGMPVVSAQVDKNLTLEDQMVHVLQQNEDLRVRIDNCQAVTQYVLCGATCCWQTSLRLFVLSVPAGEQEAAEV